MLFHYKGKPERLLRLFKSYRGLDQRLGEQRMKTRRRVLWLSVVYGSIVVIASNRWDRTQIFWFILFIAAGWLFLKLAFIDDAQAVALEVECRQQGVQALLLLDVAEQADGRA